jgi:TolB-like protein/Tfp pilus assembly protein PilF
MSSIIPDYEYDIFISYRQKDNRYDHWVTDFVDNLSKELESTFKENVGIYFDQNPHDGIHETDDVGGSLEPKLKSIIFIPIVSQTYCDPKAFAWRHELLPYVKLASNDHIGLKVRNNRGNITSRILPVRIHDLDPDDQRLFEQETDGPFRPVDFVYRASGVNRPLRPRDDEFRENHNQNNYYRDQINRVASVVKEIINAVRRDKNEPITVVQPLRSESASSDRKKINPIRFAAAALLLIVATATYFVAAPGSSLKTWVSSSTEDVPDTTRSIAVLAFADMSATRDQEYFGDGIAEELLNALAKVPDLTVISRTSAFAFKGKNEDVRDIGRKLNVAYLLEGSVRKAGDIVRITTQLIRTSDGSHVWSETYQNDFKDIFAIQDEIAKVVTNQLKLKLSLSPSKKPRDSNPEVYNLWLQAKFHLALGTVESTDMAFDLLQHAYSIDSTDARVTSALSSVEMFRAESASTHNGPEAEEHLRKSEVLAFKAIRLDSNLVNGYLTAALARDYHLDFEGEKKLLDKAMALQPNNYIVIINMAWWLQIQGQLGVAKTMFEKCVALDPMRSHAYVSLAKNSMGRRQFKEALNYSRRAIALSPTPGNYLMHGTVYLVNSKPDSAIICASKAEDEFWKLYLETMALWSQGKKKEAEAKLQLLIAKYQDSDFQIAEIYGWRGETEKSIHHLQLSAEQNQDGLVDLKITPFLNYNKDPRYVEVLKKVKLPVDP